MRLNIGCREDILDGWENIDLYYIHEGVKNLDIRELSYPKNSVDEIRAHSIIEHLTFAEGEKALPLWFSFLKPGGRISIITPDFDTLYDTGKGLGVRHVAAQLYGDWKEEGQMHKSCYQKEILIQIAEENGLKLVEDKRWLHDMHLIFEKI